MGGAAQDIIAAVMAESLKGNETPSAKLILKWLAIILGLAVLTAVVVGALLPREWHVEVSVETNAEVAAIHPLVSDAERWDEWMFDPAHAGKLELEVEGSGVGATVAWVGDGSKGEITLIESDPATGVRWDGKIETDTVNNHGRVTYQVLDGGKVKITLTDEGTLPPIIGGYFVPVMNSALSQHFQAALERLATAAEG